MRNKRCGPRGGTERLHQWGRNRIDTRSKGICGYSLRYGVTVQNCINANDNEELVAVAA